MAPANNTLANEVLDLRFDPCIELEF